MGATIAGARPLAGPIDSLEDIDVVLFIAEATEPIDRERTLLVAKRARMRGLLVAAALVSENDDARSPVLDVLREAVDMLMIVRERASIEAIVTALR